MHRLSEVPGTAPAGQPVVGYSPVVNQYLLAYTGFPPAAIPPPANNPAGQVEILGQVVTTNGVRSGNPVRISNTDPTNADADRPPTRPWPTTPSATSSGSSGERMRPRPTSRSSRGA